MIHVRTHSYSNDIAEVDEIRDVMGASNLRTSLGSNGVKIANYPLVRPWTEVPTNFTTLMSIQLLLLPVRIENSSGANGR